jgi:hypothetical protein
MNNAEQMRKMMEAVEGNKPTTQSIKDALVKVISKDGIDLDTFDSDYVRIHNIDVYDMDMLRAIRNAFRGVRKFSMKRPDPETVVISYRI